MLLTKSIVKCCLIVSLSFSGFVFSGPSETQINYMLQQIPECEGKHIMPVFNHLNKSSEYELECVKPDMEPALLVNMGGPERVFSGHRYMADPWGYEDLSLIEDETRRWHSRANFSFPVLDNGNYRIIFRTENECPIGQEWEVVIEGEEMPFFHGWAVNSVDINVMDNFVDVAFYPMPLCPVRIWALEVWKINQIMSL